MNLPNILTLFRIALVPFFVGVFYLPVSWAHFAAGWVFLLACITDWLDGYLARTLNQTSKLGAFLDPVADKLIVAISLVLLVGECETIYFIFPAVVIVAREIVISALREWMAAMGQKMSLTVTFIAKAKTLLQMMALTMVIAYHPGSHWLGDLGLILLYVSALLTIWSMCVYLKIAWPEFIEKT